MRSCFDCSHLRGDFYGGLTAGIVALPLALAFGEASGAGPMAGLWGAIFVGFFAALLGGTPSQVSGPTGPMVVVFAGVFAALEGNAGLVFAAVVVAGALQVLFGVCRLGQYVRLVPYPVVSGFMSGIGCIIIALQLPRLFGHEPAGNGTFAALRALPAAFTEPVWPALAIGVLTLTLVFWWPRTLARYVPSPLAALVIGTLLSTLYRGAPVLGDIPTGLPALVLPVFSRDSLRMVLEAGFILALLGAIDSLLTSLVADSMTRTRHDSNRELIGQGIGNAVAGLFGAIPGAGATMRTVVNIRTGGRTRLSGMFHSLALLAVVLVLAPLAQQIPYAVLAGILLKIGYDIIDFSYLLRAHKGPRWDLALMLIVLGMTVFVDLIAAVAVGVVLAALAFAKQMADIQLAAFAQTTPPGTTPDERRLLEAADGAVTLFEFTTPLSFGAAADLGHRVRERVQPGTRAIVLDFTGLALMDVSAARAVETIVSDALQAGRRVYLAGMSERIERVLLALQADRWLPPGSRYANRTEALRAAAADVAASPRSELPGSAAAG